MESTESRFAHLLQPIRELTKNWEIDVASELNDYLEELEDMCIMFDGGKTRLNFAEAALLIQGSTCIYSKKVELLHSLVYQTLEYINDKNKKKSKEAAASQEDNANGSTSSHDDSDEAEFTPLTISASTNSGKADSVMRVSVIPLPPESLIPPETHEKHKLPLISLKGEIVCSQKDFRINLFIPGDNDMIVLRSRRSTPLDDDQPSPFLLFEQQEHGGPDVAAPVDVGVDMADVGDAADDNFLPIDDHGVEMENDAEEHVNRHQATTEGRMIRERRQVDTVKLQTEEKERPPAVNVWAMHDPYTVLEQDKPFKSGKCYKVPEGLDDGGKRKRKRPPLLPDFSSWFRGIFDPPEHKLKSGPTYTDLNYIYLNTLKDKVKARKRIYRKAGVVVSDEEFRRTFLQPQEAQQQQGEEPVDGFMGAEEDNSDNEQEDLPAEFGGGPDFVSPGAQKDEMSYEDLVKLRVEQLVVNSQGYTQETALSRRVKQWQEKICPELALQEERPAFDIHDYGDRIVTRLNSVGQRRSFASLVAGMDNFEACKYLLATLQLANDYTVEIDSLAGLEESLDSMGLTLLSVHRATERFKTLQHSS